MRRSQWMCALCVRNRPVQVCVERQEKTACDARHRVAFFHVWLKDPVWAEQPKELGTDDWLWNVGKAPCGTCESSKAFHDEVKNVDGTWNWRMLKAVSCLAYHPPLDCLCGFHGDDFYTEGEPEALDHVDAMITTRFKAKIFHELAQGVQQIARPSGGSCFGTRQVTSCSPTASTKKLWKSCRT